MSELSVDQVHEAVSREWARFVELLDSVDDAGWASPTRLAGWTVADLAAHVVWGVSMEADALLRARTGAPGSAEGRVIEASSERTLVVGAVREAVTALQAEVTRVGEGEPDRPVPMPYGVVPMAVVLPIFVMEAGVHTADLAAALGQEAVLAPDVCAATVPVLRMYLPLLAAAAGEEPPADVAVMLRGPTLTLGFRFAYGAWEAADGAEPTAVITGDDDSSILLYALGRTIPGDRRIAVSGAVEVLDSFKRWCPGP
jgi:uncharacterized protein (TIGR03083 family)